MIDDLDVLINTKDAAAILGIARTNIPYYVRKNRLPVAQQGGRGRSGGSWFRKGDVLKFAEELQAEKLEADALTDDPLSRVLRYHARDYYLNLPELTVMSRQADPFRRATPVGKRAGQWLADLINQLLPGGRIIHIRGLHYIFVAKSGIFLPDGTEYVNDPKSYEFLEEASKDARWLGYVPFERIKDERNEEPRIFLPEDFASVPNEWSVYAGDGAVVPNLAEAMPTLVNGARLEHPKQPYRICLIGEKSSLSEILAPIADSVQGELLLPTGELTDTMISQCEARAAQDGRPLVVLYFSDFDPSGYTMPVTCARKLQALSILRGHDGLEIQVHAVSLTLNQVRSLSLPSTPLKSTELRRDRWITAMHHEQTEIDALCALRPEVLEQIARDAVKPFYDFTLQPRWDAAYEEWGRETREQFTAQPDYPLARIELNRRLEWVQAMDDSLKASQEYWRSRLDYEPPPDFEEPQPEIDVDPPEPLFTTDDDFLTATKKMKEYRGFENIDSE